MLPPQRRLVVLARSWYSGGPGEEYFRLQRIHASLKDVEELYANYRMDKFTEHRQVDEMLQKGLLNETFANNIKKEIDVRNEAISTRS
jgi:hypothetical protein